MTVAERAMMRMSSRCRIHFLVDFAAVEERIPKSVGERKCVSLQIHAQVHTHEEAMRGIAPITVLTIFLTAAELAVGQSGMPEGWRELPADGLLLAVYQTREADGKDFTEHDEVERHAWQTYLLDPAFVSEAPWAILVEMIDEFGGSSVNAGIDAESTEQVYRRVTERAALDDSVVRGVNLAELIRQAARLWSGGMPRAQTAPFFSAWMGVNEWRSLDTRDLYYLYSMVSIDSIDRSRFSARWSGTITPPRAGDYVFRQRRVYKGDDARLRLSINGKIVLNSQQGEADVYQSAPIRIGAGQELVLECELTHETPRITNCASAPMALITWEGPTGGERLIPATAFQHRNGEDFETPGLLGQYFADPAFSDLTQTRTDASLDLIWSWPPVAPLETIASRDVLNELIKRTLDAASLRSFAETGDAVNSDFNLVLWRIAYRMTGAERQRLVDALRGDSTALSSLSPAAMSRLARAFYMLPSGNQIDLIGEWSLARTQPRTQPGWFPGWGKGSYQRRNTGYYRMIGQVLQGPYVELGSRLCDAYLVRDDGSCNLPIAYVAAYAPGRHSGELLIDDRVREQLANESLTGDQRVTWLIAQAFLAEVPSKTGGRPNPGAGTPWLVEATLVAESDATRLWAKQEMIARRVANGDYTIARDELNEARDSATDDVRRQEIDGWLAGIDLTVQMVAAQAEEQRVKGEQSYLNELERRRSKGASR